MPLLKLQCQKMISEFREKVISAIVAYKEAIALLTMHQNLSADEKELFQEKIDVFYEQLIDLFGEEGITNYIHILGSGHMLYFLENYDCLYMYSQQGWEDLNNRCQAFLMQNTSRGGYGSSEGKGKSYTFPIVRYILRDWLWKTGLADQFFSNLDNKLYSKFNCYATLLFKSTSIETIRLESLSISYFKHPI
jgi:hypothetical protein